MTYRTRSYGDSDASFIAFAGIFIIAVVVIYSVAVWILTGWVLHVLWGWFITPTFHGAPSLGIPQAIGLAVIVGFLTSHYQKGEDDGGTILYGFISPLVALATGWVVHQFM